MNHGLDQLDHDDFDIGVGKLLICSKDLVNQISHVDLAKLEHQKHILLLIANHNLFQLDNILIWTIHSTQLLQYSNLPQRRNGKAIAILTHLDLLECILLPSLLVPRQVHHTISAMAYLSYLGKVGDTPRITQQFLLYFLLLS